jgi:CBS domain containing-hemolysin-like protein
VVQDGWRFTVTEVKGRRIKRVKVSLENDGNNSNVSSAEAGTG